MTSSPWVQKLLFYERFKCLSKCIEVSELFFTFQSLTLHFVVLSFDRYSRDDVIGEVMVELEKIDMTASEHCPVPIAREITPRSFKVRFYSGIRGQPPSSN